jgi:hypothetical protein
MSKHATLACALFALWGQAQADSDLDAIRTEIREMKSAYEARIAALEARLKAAEAKADSTGPASVTAAAEPGRGFNPELSLILQGQYAHRKDIPERGISGFLPAGEHGHGSERGLSLEHTELVFSASIDPYFSGYVNLAVLDDEVELEEAWFRTLGLGQGLSLKGGRFYSGLGYLNERHPHAWDFVDAPLMYQALFGDRFSHDGLQLKWLAPSETFLEFGLEAGNGSRFPGGGYDGNGLGAWSAFAKLGGDVGTSHSWRAGLAYLYAKPGDREGHWEDNYGAEAETLFSGRSKNWVADFVWKWAPEGNASQRNFKLQAEWFQRSEVGDMTCIDNAAEDGACADDVSAYSSRQSGWYAQGVYQFMPRWRVGARYDRLDSGTVDFGTLPLAAVDSTPSKWSLMADWSPSEFSRLRLQYARDSSMQGIDEDQWTLQYVMSLGSHGAHAF